MRRNEEADLAKGISVRANVARLIEAGDVRAPALEKRRDAVGTKHALSPLAETPLGRARLLDMISEGQYRAGVQYEALIQIYRIVQGLGLGRIVAIDLAGVGGASLSGRAFSPGEVDAVKSRYRRASRKLADAGTRAQHVTNGVLFDAQPVTDETLAPLRAGLNALSSHFNRGQGNRVLAWQQGGRPGIDSRLWEAPPESDSSGRRKSRKSTQRVREGIKPRKPGA